jgi:hypothetical protein
VKLVGCAQWCDFIAYGRDMTKRPLTLTQATALYEKYHYLQGHQFDLSTRAVIECLAVAPFDEINQHILMSQLQDVADYKKTLEGYEGSVFDVIVIAQSPEAPSRFIYRRLDDYLGEIDEKDKDVVL